MANLANLAEPGLTWAPYYPYTVPTRAPPHTYPCPTPYGTCPAPCPAPYLHPGTRGTCQTHRNPVIRGPWAPVPQVRPYGQTLQPHGQPRSVRMAHATHVVDPGRGSAVSADYLIYLAKLLA